MLIFVIGEDFLFPEVYVSVSLISFKSCNEFCNGFVGQTLELFLKGIYFLFKLIVNILKFSLNLPTILDFGHFFVLTFDPLAANFKFMFSLPYLKTVFLSPHFWVHNRPFQTLFGLYKTGHKFLKCMEHSLGGIIFYETVIISRFSKTVEVPGGFLGSLDILPKS